MLYYSATPERIFPRSPGVIGRRVQNCHPPKSVATVERILSEFKAGTKDTAEFWIQMRGRFLLIRYFAMRDPDGKYRGCLEVSQDVTGDQGARRRTPPAGLGTVRIRAAGVPSSGALTLNSRSRYHPAVLRPAPGAGVVKGMPPGIPGAHSARTP